MGIHMRMGCLYTYGTAHTRMGTHTRIGKNTHMVRNTFNPLYQQCQQPDCMTIAKVDYYKLTVFMGGPKLVLGDQFWWWTDFFRYSTINLGAEEDGSD